MAKWYFDTSVLVAAVVESHAHHAPAVGVLQEFARLKHSGYMSSHGLAEVYSVLTGTPFKPRIGPRMAIDIIDSLILPQMTLVPLESEEYLEVVRGSAREGSIGGRIHDAIHMQCAAKMKCDRVYTFNLRDFRAVAPPNMAEKIAAP